MKYLILTEKPDAARNFANALGGLSGFLPDSNDSYDIVAADGHLLQLPAPDQMVDKCMSQKYKNWTDTSLFPWDPADFNWQKRVVRGKQETLDTIRKSALGHDAIIVATDYDPSGEGAVLAAEIIEKIGWNKKVFRIHFSDETPESIKQSLLHMTDVTNSQGWGELQKGLARERFDMMSMQLSRIAIIIERMANYNVPTQNLGRLKSVIIGLINYQINLRAKYVAKHYYAIHFKDGNNNVFTSKNAQHYEHTLEAAQTLAELKSSDIQVYDEQIWEETPPKLLNLSYLSVALGQEGFRAELVLKTYQKMYLAGLVSYPRTIESKISKSDFEKLLPIAPQIAKAINLDPKLLTQTTCRKQYLADYTNHGANRPGMNVPSSLEEVEAKYGACGRAIYNTIARSYLAILADNYTYKLTKAYLVDYPDYKGSIRQPINLGYKLILNNIDNNDIKTTSFKSPALPTIYKGVNPKPAKPGHKFIIDFLNKYNIGTGATQESTLVKISTGKNRLIENRNETFNLTGLGLMQAIISQGTKIANTSTTIELQNDLEDVESLHTPMMNIPDKLAAIVNHDLPIMQQNARNLRNFPELSAENKKWNTRMKTKTSSATSLKKVSGLWKGQNVAIKNKWGQHIFTSAELVQLFADKNITFSTSHRLVTGKLETQTFNGYKFVGFKANFNNKK